MPPASAEKCLNGRTSSCHAKMPSTIDGSPFSTSDRKRTTVASLAAALLGEVEPGADTDRQSDHRRDQTRIPVPTIAFAIPPPASPVGFGIFVKKLQLSDAAPCLSEMPENERSAAASRAARRRT